MTQLNIKAKSSAMNPANLIPYEKNSRIHSESQIDMICESINTFGFLKPVLIDENKMILAGHGAVMAACRLELPTIPVRQIVGLTKGQKQGYVIADNRSSELSKWDWEILAGELDDLKALDEDMLSPVGFEDFGQVGSMHSRNGTNVTLGGDRFLLQLEFETETDLEKAFDEMNKRGIKCVILT